ncbi:MULTISPECIES: SDR family oxidoreductase [Commensalibacter]|uniref:SDR family oxidoreductase n=1 Tax=Commensalibacter TaxID=1079922 RepID=UPI0012D964D0|nr:MULTISPECIES: D-threitol dehydrogenase [Commensalibacter]MCT6842105.1 D-threitol dehydrogenase [Commensalibacter sp.]MBH9973704.1 D-threitol dehydrogenase [Commensalibacter melissae]MBI0017149.1 D-threitol dehydrogenase [Commensalibacter sp. B14384M2]MBI0019130.1 D-threitol dehydrogenase [Commensalibacter sp. W8133]MBI0049555.1 D-threitol dehydrogenase [Commensalibacter sp. B14384M3]
MSTNQMFDLSGKTALVTGGAAGIGNEIVRTFLQKGVKVALLDRLDTIDQVAKNLGPDNAIGIQVDVTNKKQVDQAVKKVVDHFGRIDIAVNCAGVALLDAAETLSEEMWNATININLTGTYWVAQAVGNVMLKQKSGSIINMASQAGVIALQKHAAYCASKAGVIGLTHVLALEWGPHGINVNAISPTVVLTELGKKAWAGKVGEDMKAQIPMRRFAEPEQIAAAAVYLASSEASIVNGANLVIDGGFTIQ